MEKVAKKRQHEPEEGIEDQGTDRKCSKRPLAPRKQQFLKAYGKKWKCLKQSTKGPSFVHCVLCRIDFSCPHGGRNDCERHVTSKTHKKLEDSNKGTVSMASMFQTQENKDSHLFQQQVTNTEAQICFHLVDANLPMTNAKRLTKMVKEMKRSRV